MLLEVIGRDLGEYPDPATFMSGVVHDAPLTLLCDQAHRLIELGTAVAAERTEDVSCQAHGVNPCQDIILPRDITHCESNVRAVVGVGPVPDEVEIPELGRECCRGFTGDEDLGPPPVRHEVVDGDHDKVVLFGEQFEFLTLSHRAIVVDDLTEHTSGAHIGKSREVNGCLGMTLALEDAPLVIAQWENVARPREFR